MSRVDRYEYEDWKDFGDRVKKYREQINMTKERFAEEINRSENFVAELEKGRTGASVHTLHQISKILKVSTDELLYGQNLSKKGNSTSKDDLQSIINRCDEEEVEILKDIITAVFPDLDRIKTKRK